MTNEKRFTITVTNYHWSCGDGCCSDSGYNLEVYDALKNNIIFLDHNWEYKKDKNARIKEGLEVIEKALGRPAVTSDYKVCSEDEYSEDSEDSEDN